MDRESDIKVGDWVQALTTFRAPKNEWPPFIKGHTYKVYSVGGGYVVLEQDLNHSIGFEYVKLAPQYDTKLGKLL